MRVELNFNSLITFGFQPFLEFTKATDVHDICPLQDLIALNAESTQQTHPEDQDGRNNRVDYEYKVVEKVSKITLLLLFFIIRRRKKEFKSLA